MPDRTPAGSIKEHLSRTGFPEGISEKGFTHRDDIFFAAVETTRMAMVVTDPNQPDNPIVFANKAFINLCGYEEQEILGNNCRMLQGPDTDPVSVKEVRESIDQVKECSVELLNYRKDGSTFWNALYISPVLEKGTDRLLYFFASQLDVSRRHDAEEALRQAQKMEAVGQLTGGIAHDFNNLLQVIVGNLDALECEPISSRGRQHIRKLSDAAERGGRLTAQLLAFARKQRLVARTINVNTLISNVSEIVSRLMGSNIAVEMQLDENLWSSRIDSSQAEQAIINLSLNARDAMPDGGRLVFSTMNVVSDDEPIHPQGVPAGRYVVVAVTDTGEGMSSETLKRAVEPFFTTKPVGKGSGMGLAMVYGFTNQSDGHLRIYSEVGVGTTMKMYFPVAEAVDPATIKSDTSTPVPKLHETVLLVEDDETIRELAFEVLEDFGYRVLQATNGVEALEIIEGSQRIDCLFTDLMMPVMDGSTLAREAAQRRPKLKVLMTTGYADASALPGTQGHEVISKPYRRSDLAKMIRRVIDGSTGVE